MPHRPLALSAALAAALTAALSAPLSVPAHAGSPQDPEVQGDCSRTGSAAASVGGAHVVCAAWFSTSGQEQPRLTGTVRTQEDLSDRDVPVRVALTWQREDGCREGWVFSDQVDAADKLEVERSCAGQTLVRALIDTDRARFTGRDLAVELTAADLARVGSGLADGDLLTRPVAYSMVLLRSSTASMELATGIVGTEPGRAYRVGS